MPRNATYKPLLFTTTIRNPERFKDFMHILYKYNGMKLTEQVIEEVEKDIFTVGLYRPTKRLPLSVKSKWASTSPGEFAEEPLTPSEAKLVYDGNDPQQHDDIKGHKEAGFAKGWPSRFDTQYKLMKTLGFVWYKMEEPIRFSELGVYLAQSIEINQANGMIERRPSDTPQYEQMAFLQAFAKYQRCNPFVRELNDNIPLILLLQVIKKLNANPQYGNCGISYKELPLVIFWKDNDAETLYQRIVLLREEYGYTPSDEVIEEICTQEILGDFKKFKLKSIVSEYPDEFVRKMRMTGLVSFRGGGRFIDINHVEDDKVEYILSTYAKYKKYDTEEAFFNYMSSIDAKLFAHEGKTLSSKMAGEKLTKWVAIYNWDTIKAELVHLERKTASTDAVLKFMTAPTRLEFLTALAIKSKLPFVQVVPNYSCDDEGLPTSTAGGNKADIECYESPRGIIVEVTMAEGRQQTMMEVWPIGRHLSEFSASHQLPSQCVFVAPSIFSDTRKQIDYTKKEDNQIIRPYSISQFIRYLGDATSLWHQETDDLSRFPKIHDFVMASLALGGSTSAKSLISACLLEFAESYPNWSLRDWQKLLWPFVRNYTCKYDIGMDEVFDSRMAAEANPQIR